MATARLWSAPLARALLCLDCEQVWWSMPAQRSQCPECGSGEFYPLARWMNREETPALPVAPNRGDTIVQFDPPKPLWEIVGIPAGEAYTPIPDGG